MDAQQLLGTRFVLGGRKVGAGIDCFGVVIELARTRGVEWPDPWRQLEEDWKAGRVAPGSGFPPGWAEVSDRPRDDDVVLMGDDLSGFGYVLDGYVWTASPRAGVHRLPIDRAAAAIRQTWRKQQ